MLLQTQQSRIDPTKILCKSLIQNFTSNKAISLSHEYRDRIYIRKDILLKLTEFGELNQTNLLSYCGLNLMKHKDILESLERKGFITRTEIPWGNKKVIKYSVTEKGLQFCKLVLEPYEEIFPRSEKHVREQS
ncbi:MAG: winged helix-turn-helix domain-containing protein [Nitrosotalea sp.]